MPLITPVKLKNINDNYKIKIVGCHKIPERSFFFKGKQFPVCARCTGIHFGYLSIFFFFTNILYINLLWSIILILPTLIDGLIQAYTKWESKNLFRLLTGILNGIGTMSIANIIGISIGNMFISLLG